MKKYLIIDTSSTDSAICLLLDEKRSIEIPLPQTNQTKELIPMIKKLLEEHQLDIKELSGIGICTGPGLFTGTRVGVMTAKALSYGSDIPLFPFSSFDLFEEKGSFAIIDAKCQRAHLFHDNEIKLIDYNTLSTIFEPIYVLEKEPFKGLPIELILSKKNYNNLYVLFQNSLPQTHDRVTIHYNTL